MHPPNELHSEDLDLEREWDECMEGMLNQRNAEHSVVVVTMNLRRYASVPRDWQAVHRELSRILVDAPDVICLQEGLEGMDILSQVGYKRIASSVLRAQALRDAVYGSAVELNTCSSSSHGRLLVNELYIKSVGSKWEAIDSGAAQISSDLILEMEGHEEREGCGAWPLATRCVVWTKLRHCQKPAGPFVYVLNTQLSGGRVEDPHFLVLAEERAMQMQRLLELFDSHLGVAEGDLGILAGSLGAHPKDIGPVLVPDASNSGFHTDELRKRFQDYLASPFNVLADHRWKLAYDHFQVGSTSPEGRLVDHMATNYETPVQAEVLSSGSHMCLSDNDFVKAKFSVQFQQVQESRRVPLHSAVRERRVDAMVQGLKSAQWMKNGALAAAAKAGANQRMRLRCEQEDLRRQLQTEKHAADELQTELTSEMRELRDRCHEQGQTVGLLTQRLADARSAIAAELQDAATERAALRGELMSEESQRQKLQATLMHEEAEASSRVEAADQQLASMVAVRDSLQAQLQSALKVQAELREHIAAEREGRAELEVAGERELLAWERIKESSVASPSQMQSVHDEQSRLRQHLNAEAAICQQEAEAFRHSLQEVTEEIQENSDNKQRAMAALGAVGCEWPVLQEEAAEAVERASAKEAEVEGVRRRTRDFEKQLERLREDILQCRQDNIALELKKERDLLNEEVHTEALRQEELLMELDAARRSRSIFQCLFPRSQPPPPPSTPPPQRTKPPPPQLPRTGTSQPGLERAPTSAAPMQREQSLRRAEVQNMPASSSEETSSDDSDSAEEKLRRPPARTRPQGEPDFIESDEV